MSAPNLKLVDADTGELVEAGCPMCETERIDRENLEGELRKALRRVRELKQNREKEAKVHPRRQEVEQVFDLWRELCRHPNAKLDADRTFLIAGMIDRYDVATCEVAIRGAAFDPFVTKRKNGTVKRHDGIALVFTKAEKFEEFACRAPREQAA